MSEDSNRFSPNSNQKNDVKRSNVLVRLLKMIGKTLILLLISIVAFYFYVTALNKAPVDFPVNTPIVIEKGTEVRMITELFEESGLVRSANLLYYVLALLYEPTTIKASTYIFDEPLTTLEIAKRLTQGDFDTDLIRFTHIEGERTSLLAKRAAELLPNFNEKVFLDNTEDLEGRLFPDTYFVPVSYTDEELLRLLLSTFDEKMANLQPQIDDHSLTLDEILVLASIIEREANTPESKKLVSSVLQNRIETGMPLQADASIEYILDKPLSELVPADLEIESPYNTYLYRGLPPTPIGNPGLDAIMAVLEPAESEYYYYITSNKGEFHFAETYNRHLMNIEKYLR